MLRHHRKIPDTPNEGAASSTQNEKFSSENAPLRQSNTKTPKNYGSACYSHPIRNPSTSGILEHCESAVTCRDAPQPNEGDLRKYTSTPGLFKQADSLVDNSTPEIQLQKHAIYKLHQGADSGSANKKIHSENPLRGQAAKQHEDQSRLRNGPHFIYLTYKSKYVNQVPSKHAVKKRDGIEKYCPDQKYWPEESHFPSHSLVKPEQVPYIGSAREKNQVWNKITAKHTTFESYNLPFTTSEDVCFALWKGNNVIISTRDRCDLILGWHRSEKIFLVIKLFTKKNGPHLEELMYRGTTSLFLSGTRSIPWFYGLIYVGSSPKYVSFGLVNRFIGTDLEPTTFRNFIDCLQNNCITNLPHEYQVRMQRRAVFMCIHLIDQLQKIHDYGAVLNTFPPQTILIEFDKDDNAIPYFTHLTDITYQMDTLGRRASDFVLAKLKNSSQCLRQLSSMTADPNENKDSSFGARRADDIEIGQIIYAVGRATDLPAVTWLGERLLCTRPSKRPGLQQVRIQLARTFMNLKQQTDHRSSQMKSSKMLSVDSRNDHDHVDYFHLAEQHANAFKESHSTSACSTNYMGNNPVNLKQPVFGKENYSNGQEHYDKEKSTHHEEKIYSHEANSDEEDVSGDESDNSSNQESGSDDFSDDNSDTSSSFWERMEAEDMEKAITNSLLYK